MPGSINGADFAKISTRLWPSIPVVVMSGLETSESTGMDQNTIFIRKPYTLDEVLAEVRTAFHGETSA